MFNVHIIPVNTKNISLENGAKIVLKYLGYYPEPEKIIRHSLIQQLRGLDRSISDKLNQI